MAKDSAQEELAQLRREMDALSAPKVAPILSEAADKATDAARQVRDYTTNQADVIAERVRAQPLAAMAIGLGIGFVFGRVLR